MLRPFLSGTLTLLSLLVFLRPVSAGKADGPTLLQVDANFGSISGGTRLEQDIPDLLDLLGLTDAPPTGTLELYRKAALLEFLEAKKAFLFSHQGDALYSKFQAMQGFFKAQRNRIVPDNDPALRNFLRQNGTSRREMEREFENLMDIRVDADGTAHGLLTDGSLGESPLLPLPVPIRPDKIRVVPFSATDGDLPEAARRWIPGQIMQILKTYLGDGTLEANEASYLDLSLCTRELLADASVGSPPPGVRPLVRLEYEYDRAASVLTLRAGTKHTVSNVLIFHYTASDAGGLQRKRELERLLRTRLNRREMLPGAVREAVREITADYLGRHAHPQPTALTVRYEEDSADLFGLVKVDINEGAAFLKPRTLTAALENNVPSGRLTGRVSVSNRNFLRRGITLTADGSIGGDAGANLRLDAPSGIFRDRAWQVDGGFANIPNVRLASGTFEERRRMLEIQFPLSSEHPPSDAPFYTKYYPTGYRYRLGRYDLTPNAGGERQRSTVGILGFSWRSDPGDYWEQPPVPRSLLGTHRAPVWTKQPPFQSDIDVGAKLLGGDSYFARIGFEARTHLALSSRWLLALRGSARWASDATPPLEQPALGGDTAPTLLRAFNPEYFRGRQVEAGTVEVRYFTTDNIALTLGGDFGIASGGAAPGHGLQDSLALGVYLVRLPQLNRLSLGIFWATGSGSSRWSLAVTGGF